MYSLVPDRTAADRQLVRGVGASDRSSTRPLVPPAILPFSKPRSFGARHCGAGDNATDPVKGRAGGGEHDLWKWKSEASVETELSGLVGPAVLGVQADVRLQQALSLSVGSALHRSRRAYSTLNRRRSGVLCGSEVVR